MSAVDSTVIERDTSAGRLVFEHHPAGSPAKNGEPRKTDWRSYTLDGARLPSVTTIINACLPKEALYRWHEDRGAEGAARAAAMGELDLSVPEEAGGRVRLLELGADAAKKKGATRGLSLHSLLEDYSRTGQTPSLDDHPVEHRGYVQALARWLLANRPEAVSIEQIVCHPELGYAGRMDLRALIDGRDLVVDLKTNPKGRIYLEAHLQAVAYSMADVASGADEPSGAIVVSLGAEGTFEQVECMATPEMWLAVIGQYKALAPLRSTVGNWNRGARKATA